MLSTTFKTTWLMALAALVTAKAPHIHKNLLMISNSTLPDSFSGEL